MQRTFFVIQLGVFMRSAVLLISLLSFLAVGKVAVADQGDLRKLMQRNNCLACHMIDKRRYGPNMQEIAVKYAGDTNAVELLAVKIKAGGAGVWGADMMPAQPHVTDENALLMAQLIMKLNAN